MSYATILIPGSGVIDSYSAVPEQLGNALGIYLITWFIFTFLMLIGALRKNVSFVALFACLAATFAVLAVAQFTGKVNLAKAGGALGIITAFIAYYCAVAELLVKEESFFTLPLGQIPKRD